MATTTIPGGRGERQLSQIAFGVNAVSGKPVAERRRNFSGEYRVWITGFSCFHEIRPRRKLAISLVTADFYHHQFRIVSGFKEYYKDLLSVEGPGIACGSMGL